ncbi:MAG: zinc-binding dehydrogenase [Myxococcales bacterium]
MGREFDGSYAEYASVPSSNVFPLDTALPWDVLGALPEMLQTCHGSLHTGLATLSMAKVAGLRVICTSRSEAKIDMLRKAGADEVVIDDGELGAKIRNDHPGGVDRVLELIGTTTLLDSLKCARPGGVVCMTGILGGQWELGSFRPIRLARSASAQATSKRMSSLSPMD